MTSAFLMLSCTKDLSDQSSFSKVIEVADLTQNAHLPANSVKRPFSDFLIGQGSSSSFLPPVPDFYGWGSELADGTVRALAMDYLGVANQTIIDLGGPDLGTQVSGSVTEIPLADGRANVTVILHVSNALIWLTDVDFAQGGDFATDPLIMGARPAEVVAGATPALGSGNLKFVFINTAPGAAIPDIMLADFGEIDVPGFELQQLKITATGTGTLHNTPLHMVPWSEGDSGKMSLSFTGLFHNSPSPKSKLARNFGFVGSEIKVNRVGKNN
jgi:hypothetical protein